MNDNVLVLNRDQFKKASKKLLTQLKTQSTLSENLSLSQIHEMLSKSLGYRSWHELDSQGFTQELTHLSENHDSYHWQTDYSSEEIKQILNLFLKPVAEKNKQWISKTHHLISIVVDITTFIYKEDKLFDSIDYRKLDSISQLHNLHQLFVNRRDFPNSLRYSMEKYLTSLPNYSTYKNDLKPDDLTIEYHNYILAPLQQVLHIVKNFEKDDYPSLYEPKWFECGTLIDPLKNNKLVKKSWLLDPTFKSIKQNPQRRDFSFFDLLRLYLNEFDLIQKKSLEILILNIINDYQGFRDTLKYIYSVTKQ